MDNIIDAVASVVWRVDGQEELDGVEERLDSTTAASAATESQAQDMADSIEDAGSRGSQSMGDLDSATSGISISLGQATAASAAFTAAMAGVVGFTANAAANLEDSRVRIQAFARDDAGQIFDAADRLESATGGFFAAGTAMEAASSAVVRGIDAELIGDLLPAMGTLAITTGQDLPAAMSAFESALIRPQRGFRQLAMQGLISLDTMRDIEKQMEQVEDASDMQARRQIIMNAVLTEANQRYGMQEEILGTVSSQTQALWEEIGNLAELMGEPFVEPLAETLADFRGIIAGIDATTAGAMGRLTAFGAIFGGLFTTGLAVVGAFKAFGALMGTVGAATAVAGGQFVLAGIGIAAAAIAIADFVSWLIRGESLILNWDVMLGDLIEKLRILDAYEWILGTAHDAYDWTLGSGLDIEGVHQEAVPIGMEEDLGDFRVDPDDDLWYQGEDNGEDNEEDRLDTPASSGEGVDQHSKIEIEIKDSSETEQGAQNVRKIAQEVSNIIGAEAGLQVRTAG